MTDAEWDTIVGRMAFLAGEPYESDESEAWQVGFGDAIVISEVPE